MEWILQKCNSGKQGQNIGLRQQYGHIAMWSGTQWISDFKQNGIIVNSAYNNGKSSIFRWE